MTMIKGTSLNWEYRHGVKWVSNNYKQSHFLNHILDFLVWWIGVVKFLRPNINMHHKLWKPNLKHALLMFFLPNLRCDDMNKCELARNRTSICHVQVVNFNNRWLLDWFTNSTTKTKRNLFRSCNTKKQNVNP